MNLYIAWASIIMIVVEWQIVNKIVYGLASSQRNLMVLIVTWAPDFVLSNFLWSWVCEGYIPYTLGGSPTVHLCILRIRERERVFVTIIIVCVLFGFLCSHLTTVYMTLNMHVAHMNSALILNLDNINVFCLVRFIWAGNGIASHRFIVGNYSICRLLFYPRLALPLIVHFLYMSLFAVV